MKIFESQKNLGKAEYKHEHEEIIDCDPICSILHHI